MKNIIPSLLSHFDSKVFILPRHDDFEFTGILTCGFARNFLHVMSLSRSPGEALADQTQSHEAYWRGAAYVVSGRRSMVNEKQVTVQSMNRDGPRFVPDYTSQ